MKRKPKQPKWRPQEWRPLYPENSVYPEFRFLDPRIVAAVFDNPVYLRMWSTFKPVDPADKETLQEILEDAIVSLPRAARTLRRILAVKFPGRKGRPRRTIQEVWDAPSIVCYDLARAYCDRGEVVETHWKEIKYTAAVKVGWHRSNPYHARAMWADMKAKVKTRLLREGHWIKKNTIDIT